MIKGEVPMFLHVTGVATVRRAVEWGAEQGYRIVLVDSGDAWRAADLLAEHNVPVIIGSILAAFAVDAWWAAALNADKEREHPGYREDRTGKVLRTQTGPA